VKRFPKNILRQDLLIFDEIQRCPFALTSLKCFCEEMNVFEDRYQPRLSYVLSTKNELTLSVARRRHIPLYAAGIIRGLIGKTIFDL
jgi:hypothetical protein